MAVLLIQRKNGGSTRGTTEKSGSMGILNPKGHVGQLRPQPVTMKIMITHEITLFKQSNKSYWANIVSCDEYTTTLLPSSSNRIMKPISWHQAPNTSKSKSTTLSHFHFFFLFLCTQQVIFNHNFRHKLTLNPPVQLLNLLHYGHLQYKGVSYVNHYRIWFYCVCHRHTGRKERSLKVTWWAEHSKLYRRQ